MAQAGGIIGGLLRGFTEGFDDQARLGALFEQNKLSKEKFQATKRRQNFLDFQQAVAVGFKQFPAGKLREQYMETIGSLFPDHANLVGLFGKVNDNEAESVISIGNKLRESGIDPIRINAIAKSEGLVGLAKLADQQAKSAEAKKGLEIAGEDRRPQITEQNIPQTETARAGAFQRRFGAQVQRAQQRLEVEENKRRRILSGKGGQAARQAVETQVSQARADLKRAEDQAQRHRESSKDRLVFEAKRDKEGSIIGLRAILIGRNKEGKVVFRDALKNEQGKELDIPASQAQVIGDLISGGAGAVGEQGGGEETTDEDKDLDKLRKASGL